jgi:NADH dehydrogenase
LLDEEAPQVRYELAGPETLDYTQITTLLLRAAGRPRRLIHVPTPIVSRALRATEAILKSKAPATWDEAELMEVPMTAPGGTADAERLGVVPRPMQAVLGVA